MEARPLNTPNPLLERCVAALIPPAARETVLGDLFELYQSPAQYVGVALRTLPFVVAAQIRRQANIPILIMQALMVSACFGGLMLSLRQHLNMTNIAMITMACVSAMLLSEAYRGDKPASEKRAILEAIAVASLVLAYAFYALAVTLHANRLYSHLMGGWSLFSWLILPFGMPALCALRAGLIVGRGGSNLWSADHMSRDDLVGRYQQFEAQMRSRNQLEVALLAFTGALCALAMWRAELTPGLVGSLLAVIYAVTPVYLLIYGAPLALPAQANFFSLREMFRHEMAHQYQLRAFVGWLAPAPLLFLLYAEAFRFSAGPNQQLWLVYATMATLFVSFLVLALNGDRGAQLRSITNHLDRLRERSSN